MVERDFKGVWIPREVWLDDRLNMLDKGILTEIDSLDMGENGCFASNEYLAKFCQCSVTKVSTSISRLIELGYVRVASFDGRKRFLKSCLSKIEKQNFKNCNADIQNLKDSNTSSNTRSKSNTRKRVEGEIPDGFAEFYSAYPRKVSKQNAIKAWIKLGAADSRELADRIIADVRKRVEGEWAGKDMQYIPHPSTYLNQKRWEDETGVEDIPFMPSWDEMTSEEQEAALKSGPFGRFY